MIQLKPFKSEDVENAVQLLTDEKVKRILSEETKSISPGEIYTRIKQKYFVNSLYR